MAWIESHTVLRNHRKVLPLSRALRIGLAQTIGHLHLLWHAALEQQENGDLTKWSDELIAELAGYQANAPQFVRLLQEFGWLDGKVIHDWWDYAGRFLQVKYKNYPEKWQNIKKLHIKMPEEPPNNSPKNSPKNLLPNQTNLTKNPPNPPPAKPREREKTGETVYEHYAKTIKSGAREDALKSINRLLVSGESAEGLIARIDAYKASLLKDKKADPTYWIQANNFFGRAARWKEFEPKFSMLKPVNPNCKLCSGTGFVYNQSKSETEVCPCRKKAKEP